MVKQEQISLLKFQTRFSNEETSRVVSSNYVGQEGFVAQNAETTSFT